MYSIQALQVLIFLIPGFISAVILNTLSVLKDKKEFGKVIEALIFSLIIYTVYSVINSKLPLQVEKIENSISYTLVPVPFLMLMAISVVLPLILSFLVTNDWHMRLARTLRITNRTARTSVWFDVFYDVRKLICTPEYRRDNGYPGTENRIY